MNDIEGNVTSLVSESSQLVVAYGIKLILAIAVYVVGKWVVNVLVGALEKSLNSRGVDPTVASFTRNISYYALLTMVVIAALGQLGVQTASFVAIVGAAGLAIGFALQGSLANFASGVLLILFRPFKIGDFVEAGGTAGVVHEISIFSTILKTPDNKTVIVSNSAVMGGNIVNYSTEKERRVDITVGVSYSANLSEVKTVLQEIIDGEERILKERESTIAVAELADSSVNFVFRVWVETGNYWPVFFDLNEKIKVRLDEKNIEIPFPQMDVHLIK
ncbi:mechanosensitive ion channel family protein [Agarilytica rhodophyticola]|uniref:mechanosensitive ion channel family protein n=1 Tax=Agarilytica rhodophyticola TaxID=1737490 RepID=UPI000B345627|nr:mechanosensitive ion channel domain-containing protein [Agarilytica rhodophyticola]